MNCDKNSSVCACVHVCMGTYVYVLDVVCTLLPVNSTRSMLLTAGAGDCQPRHAFGQPCA